ncbi:MAG TPA: serine/threonine-protein kinase, partial [Polyangiaceae bacterium]|nr:serine/threonine-protein kinase [Polyangiaceae bacterium]
TPPGGLIAGKYEVLRLIGRGGMGSVWEGRHVTLGTRVAIKFIDQEYAESKEACARFVTEARAAATIQSKHAIQIFDHGVTDEGRPYMVMELLTGEPLDERIDRLIRLSLPETARILGQVCRALQRAHEAGIIHRDLKPENIFLVRSPDDDDEIAKVLDFGIAKIKQLPGEQGLTSSTKTGAVLGTPYYMAPEQARGLRSIDYRADLWSLGVIAYKCVTGVLPFEGESVGDLLVKICTAPAPIPSLTVPGLPPGFDAWFARTMEREPAARFASAAQLAEGLAVAAGISVRRGPMSSVPHGAPPPGTPMPPVMPERTPLPGAGLTSAPFVTSASPPKSSRGAVFAVAVAALLGGTLGVVGVVKLLAHPAPTTSATPLAPPTPTATAAAGAMGGPGPTPTASAAEAASAATAAATSTASAVAVKPTTLPPSNGRGKPAATAKPAAAATTTAATPATTRAPAPKSTAPSSDPGY